MEDVRTLDDGTEITGRGSDPGRRVEPLLEESEAKEVEEETEKIEEVKELDSEIDGEE